MLMSLPESCGVALELVGATIYQNALYEFIRTIRNNLILQTTNLNINSKVLDKRHNMHMLTIMTATMLLSRQVGHKDLFWVLRYIIFILIIHHIH